MVSSTADTGGGGDNGCSITNPLSWVNCALRGIAGLILTLCTFLLAIAGSLLNWVVLRAVFQFSLLVGNSPGLLTAWSILRDLGNMLLLFGFIFIGLATILDLHTYTAKKALPRLIIFAVLMNFSLFAAEGIIDVSNGLTSVIYTQASAGSCVSTDVAGGIAGGGDVSNDPNADGKGFEDCARSYGISGSIMQSMGITSIFGIDDPTDITVVTLLGLSILSLVAATVIFAAAIMLLFRAVMLTFLMVLAPLGFAGMAIPPLQGAAKDWWHRLINQAFYAPVMFLLIFVSLSITKGLAASDTRNSLAYALSHGNSGSMGVLMVFGIVIAFLVASMIAAKKFGAAGASFATNMGAKFAFGGFARTASFGTGLAAFGARRGLQKWAPDNAASKYVRSRVLQRIEGANLDLRRVGGGALLSAMGATAGAKPSDHASFSDVRHRYHELRADEHGKELDKQEETDVKKRKLKAEAKAGTLSVESEQFLASLSAEQIAADHDLQHSIEQFASNLSTSQFEGLMKSDKLKQNVKDSLARERYSNIPGAITSKDKDVIRNLTNKDLELLAKYQPQYFKDLVDAEVDDGDSLMSVEQTDHLAKNETLAARQRDEVKKNTKVGRINTLVDSSHARYDPVEATRRAKTLSSKSKAKLLSKTLTDPAVIETLTAADLADIQREGKLTPREISDITYAVTSTTHPNHRPIIDWLNNHPNADAYWQV